MQLVTKRALHTVLRVSNRAIRTAPNPRFRYPATSATSPLASSCICSRCQLHTTPRQLQNALNTDQPESVPSAPKEKDKDQEENTPVESQSKSDDPRLLEEEPPQSELLAAVRTATGGDAPEPDQPDRRTTSGRITVRGKVTRRPAKPKEEPLPKLELPDWFLEQAVFLPSELQAKECRLEILDQQDQDIPLEVIRSEGGESGSSSSGRGKPGQEKDVDRLLKFNESEKTSADAESDLNVLPEKTTIAEADVVRNTEIESASAPEAVATSAPESQAEEPTKQDAVVESGLRDQVTPPTSEATAETGANSNENESTPVVMAANPPPEEPLSESASSVPAKPEIAFFTPSNSFDRKYLISPAIWAEVWSTVRANLSLPKNAFNQTQSARRANCVLLFPQNPETNGTYFLDAVSEELARRLGATLIRIDAEDVAEIAGDYIEKSASASSPVGEYFAHKLRTIGYESQHFHPNNRYPPEEDIGPEEEIEATEEVEAQHSGFEETDQPYPVQSGAPSNDFLSAIGKMLGSKLSDGGMNLPIGVIKFDNGPVFGGEIPGPETKPINEQKLHAVLEGMLDSGVKKSEAKDTTNSGKPSDASNEKPTKTQSSNRTIIQVRDFRELWSHMEGRNLLRTLTKMVFERRLEGREIMILGNSATYESGTEINTSFLRELQQDLTNEGRSERTIVVAPQAWAATRSLLERDRSARIREINLRHLRGQIARRSGEGDQAVVLKLPNDWHFMNSPEIPHSSDWIWTLDYTHRLCLAVLGNIREDVSTTQSVGPREVHAGDVASAVRILKESDAEKVQWATLESELEDPIEPDIEAEHGQKIKNITKKCNTHEKKLLGGVIDASSIKTGFDAVRAAPETVEALKTLTSLSLLRPEAFSYGVLATDRIPGVLLYGPPGTGKTLLAKAVAKESGATVLEVSGSEVFDMYVGEGEKNVKAIFSLAKKLSPCVVFIDEADAIFGSRASHQSRTSHRELINQFLKEWDGMSKTLAFIMVATNRPFDLDDAVLRRLPRRILIDLPTSADRLAILKIHLRDELLAEDVNLESIAADERTNLYSGSDLKNVAVSAALAAVREEETLYAADGKEYPERRTLQAKHFEQALNEITASISDDMGSLGLIRKFDERYGDRKGRKKKISRWGFGSGDTKSSEKDEVKERGTGRVRN